MFKQHLKSAHTTTLPAAALLTAACMCVGFYF